VAGWTQQINETLANYTNQIKESLPDRVRVRVRVNPNPHQTDETLTEYTNHIEGTLADYTHQIEKLMKPPCTKSLTSLEI